MKIKDFINKNKYYIIIILFLSLLTYLFPYTGDDFVWGSFDFKISFFKDIFSDNSLNGRYLGDLFVVIMTKNRIVRVIIMTVVITLIVKIISYFSKTKINLALILFLIMPLDIFNQTIVWTSGFANYAISSLLFLYSLYLLKNSNNIILVLFIFIISCLFIENVSAFLALYSIFINIKYYIKNKKVNMIYLIAFFGSVIGNVIMFSHPGYLMTIMGKDNYRAVGNYGGIFANIGYNYFDMIYRYVIFDNYIFFILLLSVMFIYYLKNLKSYHKSILFVFSFLYLILVYFVFAHVSFLHDKNIINGLISLGFIINIFILMYILFRNKKEYSYITYIIGIIMGVLAPLFIVNPLGPRNFILIYILNIILLLKIFNSVFGDVQDNRLFKVISWIILSLIMISFMIIYGRIYVQHKVRDDYIISHRCHSTIAVPEFNNNRYVWWENPEGYFYPNYYKSYYKIDESINFIFVSYDEWEKIIKNISTCD